MTSLAEEQACQREWRLRPKVAKFDYCNQLVVHEFVSPDQQAAWRDQQLAETVAFAAQQAPYYQRVFQERGLTPGDITGLRDLPKLPVLTKRDVQQHLEDLRPRSLTGGKQAVGMASSSGTTGRPTRVYITVEQNNMFTYLSQRAMRWFRWRPEGKLAWIRTASTMPRLESGAVLPDGLTYRSPQWRYVGALFSTGPMVGFNRTNPIEDQFAWMREERPDYLLTFPSAAEAMAIAHPDGPPNDNLKGVWVVSSQLTPAMRRRIEGVFGVPVQQTYGLNENGIVACRCEAGRYHVHVENCVVELVNDAGEPCAAGETGRVLATGLRNKVTPLLRYDTGDMAEAVEGPCPCGRTLPSFGYIKGRYWPWNHTPPGTAGRMDRAIDAIQVMDSRLIEPVRQYQLHQYRDNTFVLRVIVDGRLPEAFGDTLLTAWRQDEDEAPTLTIEQVDHIEPAPGGKHQEFTSDFFPHPGAD